MNKSYIFLIFFIVTLSSSAQFKNGKVVGIIKDNNDAAIEAATITLLKYKDSSISKVSVSDKNGQFTFEQIVEGQYTIKANAIGYMPYVTLSFEISAEHPLIQFPELKIAIQGSNLSTVSVTAKKPLIETRSDRTIINVGSSIIDANTNILNVLEKSPGVTVDNGVISIKGKQGVIVLIDGKQTYLSGQELTSLLQNYSSSQVDQIEIFSQPPAKYDGTGSAGLINIKTKRNLQKGYNGSISLGYIQGRYPRINNTITFNYRNSKWNLFSNYSYSHTQDFGNLNVERFYGINGDEYGVSSLQNIYRRTKNNTHSFQSGFEFYLKKGSIGIVLSGLYNPEKSISDGYTSFKDRSDNLIGVNKTIVTAYRPWNNININFNFKKQFGNNGGELVFDADRLSYYIHTSQNSDGYNYDDEGNLVPFSSGVLNPFLSRANLPSMIRVYSVKTDYTYSLNKDIKFETGWKSSLVNIDNDAQYHYIENEMVKVDTIRTNRFLYGENINAIYLSYRHQLTKWMWQIGVRAEQTNVSGKQTIKVNNFNNQYINLFPSALLNYNLNKDNSISLSYSRRIDRPSYQVLNPFETFLDQYNTFSGNPYLRPQKGNNIELSYNWKGKLNVSANYTQTNNVISQILSQNDTTQVVNQRPENINSRKNTGITVSYNNKVAKWFTTISTVTIYRNLHQGVVNNLPLNLSVASFIINSNNQFAFGKSWNAELSVIFRSRRLPGGIIEILPIGYMNIGVSKQLWKNVGLIRLGVNDVLNTYYFRNYTRFGNIKERFNGRNNFRYLAFTFTWRFNKGQVKGSSRKVNSVQDEQNRVGGVV